MSARRMLAFCCVAAVAYALGVAVERTVTELNEYVEGRR